MDGLSKSSSVLTAVNDDYSESMLFQLTINNYNRNEEIVENTIELRTAEMCEYLSCSWSVRKVWNLSVFLSFYYVKQSAYVQFVNATTCRVWCISR